MKNQVTVIGSHAQFDKTVEFAGATASGSVDLGGLTLIGVVTPASLVGTTFTVHAPVGYVAGVPGATYVALTDDTGTNVTFTVSAAAEHITFTSALIAKLRGVRHLKLVSGSAETNVITLVTSVI